MVSQSERATRWREHVERWRSSGQTQTAYCAEQGLNKKSLGYWVRRLREPSPPEHRAALTLVSAHLVAAQPLPATSVLALRSPSGWCVEFGALPPATWLAELVAREAQ